MDKGQSQGKIKRAKEESTEGASTSSFTSSEVTGVGSSQYDVFLSFRGSDIRCTFTDHLYHSLIKAGTIPFCVFRDENNIPIGEEFGSEILDAIARSKISIPVISENYASSKWCLRELVHIMDRKKSAPHIVLPIFYKVAPSDVRHLKGNFGNAFHSSRKHFDEKDIQEGQRALNEVSYLNGWESQKIADRHEGKLIECVVEIVISKLQEDFQLDVPEKLVGLDDRMKEIMNWIDKPSINARMIGIYGMGGIGKTTLAKCICNQLSNKFVHLSFLSDVQETTRCHGITHLQSQLISDILLSKIQVSTIDEGINIIKSRFKRKKILILLDDIDHNSQLDALARERHWFMAGSVIIVTTRNEAVLDQSKFEVDRKYELNELGSMQALLLFNRHAFGMDHSPREFEGISRDIISNMGGLPLALKVVGSYLYKKMNRKVWEDVREQLKNEPHRDVEKILQISYDALKDGHKQIFLDIVCFFIGKTSEYAMYMWEDCGFYPNQGIEELKLRCLIKIGDRGEFLVHDQLRDLGRSIFCQGQPLEKRSGPWDDVYEGVPKVLRIDERASKRLKVLILDKCYNLICTPDVSAFTQLKRISLVNCYKLKHLHPSIGKLVSLVSLDLSACVSLQELLEELGELKDLEELLLSETDITEIHTSIGSLRKLEKLSVVLCELVVEIPGSIGELQNLQHLDMRCSGIKKLPSAIGRLKNLRTLNLSRCHSLKGAIPSEIGDLPSLEDLDLNHTPISNLPESVRNLSSLQRLDLWGCNELRSLPELPSGLTDLSVTCQSLGLPQLFSLIHLKKLDLEVRHLLEDIHEPSSIPLKLCFDEWDKLTSLWLEGVPHLEELSIKKCSSLEVISLWDCNSIERLCCLELPCLKKLTALDCDNLVKIEGLDGAEFLEMLDFEGCKSMETLLDLTGCEKLRSLSVRDCKKLTQLQGLEMLSLIHLNISGCDSLEAIPKLSGTPICRN